MGLLLLIWTWRHEEYFDPATLTRDFCSELFRLQFFAVDLAAYESLEQDPDKYDGVSEALDAIQIQLLESPDDPAALAAAAVSGGKRSLAVLLNEISHSDPTAYARFQRAKAFAPKFPRDEDRNRLYTEVLALSRDTDIALGPVVGMARVLRTFCDFPKDPIVPMKIFLTYETTHGAALKSFGSWRVTHA